MDFVSGVPCTQRNVNSKWFIVDRLTKSDHFLKIKMDHLFEHFDDLYINQNVRIHVIPVPIVSGRD